jgi:hypothetical protein
MFKITSSVSGLSKLRDKLKKLENMTEISLGVLFNDKFISKHSSFSNLDDLCKASGFKIENKDDFLAIPDDEWNTFISGNTSFSSWEEMQRNAFTEHLENEMKL